MFTITKTVPVEKVVDLLCSAFEGGSNYWIDSVSSNTDSIYDIENKNYALTITVYAFRRQEHVLTQDKLKKGIQVMHDDYNLHFRNFDSDMSDAETGDVFLQCCIFGEVVYG